MAFAMTLRASHLCLLLVADCNSLVKILLQTVLAHDAASNGSSKCSHTSNYRYKTQQTANYCTSKNSLIPITWILDNPTFNLLSLLRGFT
jgi:hypothetical protein